VRAPDVVIRLRECSAKAFASHDLIGGVDRDRFEVECRLVESLRIGLRIGTEVGPHTGLPCVGEDDAVAGERFADVPISAVAPVAVNVARPGHVGGARRYGDPSN
jgi:hypothetical protein